MSVTGIPEYLEKNAGFADHAGPLFTGFAIGSSVGSGESSVGQSVGEIAGGIYGYDAGHAMAKKFIPNLPDPNASTRRWYKFGPNWKRGLIRGTIGMATSMVAGHLGGKIGNVISPYKRSEKTVTLDSYGNTQSPGMPRQV